MLETMVARPKKTAKKRLDDARTECIRLARAIIRHWPKRHVTRHSYGWDSEQSQLLDAFPKLLPQIDDVEAVCQFLEAVRERDAALDLGN
jgi:hypothetical protein